MWTSALIALLQHGVAATPGNTTPPSGDTVGYWQQRVTYTITATLDERAQRVHSRGTLWYVNNSPDTLREMYVHQYLNAFRPGSKWSEVDEREGRERFQRLQDPHYGYERFTAPVQVNGVAVAVDYPGAPDSTVAHFRLPSPLAQHDSLSVAFEWDARPSTVPRRQGRRGRQWDLAQWYPKVAVYDRGGWEYNALQPAGELYGEFGTYDVTFVVAQDQVIGATGVPVSGDPGWSRVLRSGTVRAGQRAYDGLPPAPTVDLAAGQKAVRFFARDVHHFAWTASPDYRYDGGVYVRAVPNVRWPTWDTVSIHALYGAGDDSSWGGLKVVRRTINALQWLESIYGPYAYPQMTVLHRLDGGGTEFPMMQMNGSPSQGLILHEGGHVFTYGILANNEWRSGWMDEGLTSFQTEWAQGFLPQERVRAVMDQPLPVRGYRAHGIRMALPRFEATALDQAETDMRGEAQPIGTVAQEFRDFGTYNDMIYTRAQVMYGQLRDVLGDSLFAEFLHDYYARWALKHVDELAMRASAERVSGRDLGWFFDEWVHHTGLMDYRLVSFNHVRDSSGLWTTDVTVERSGQYHHRIAVGVRTEKGWTLSYTSNAPLDGETVRIETKDEPLEVRLDPLHFSWDWDRRNDIPRSRKWFGWGRARSNFEWPFLVQADRERDVSLWRPMTWFSRNGGVTPGIRFRSSYLGWLDQVETGIAAATRDNLGGQQRLQYWMRTENPTFGRRPHVGWRGGFAFLDDIMKFDIGFRRQTATARRSMLRDVALTWTEARAILRDPSFTRDRLLVPELWDPGSVDLAGRLRWQAGASQGSYSFVEPNAMIGFHRTHAYTKSELAIGRMQVFSDDARLALRAYGGFISDSIPSQRALYLSANDPVSTFENHWWRPADAILKQPAVSWLPLGGAALRGYSWDLADKWAYGGNVDGSRRILSTSGSASALGLWMHAFGDAANTRRTRVLLDAGVGLSVRGRLYDRNIFVRLDAPFYVREPAFAIDRGRAGAGQFAPRWVLSFNDVW